MKRLDKFLVEMSVASRSVIKEMAKKGRITVNGEVMKASDIKIDENSDVIAVDGMIIAFSDMEYFMLNKPAGVITATMDKKAETVLDLIDERTRNDLFPVGRLDKDTEGLLLFTNDGQFDQKLMHPKHHAPKKYYLFATGELGSEAIDRIESGQLLTGEDKPTKGAAMTITERGKYEDFEKRFTPKKRFRDNEFNRNRPVFAATLEIYEGKKHQVKRMMLAEGCRVIYLKRFEIGGVKLDESLKPGEYRKLTEAEYDRLMSGDWKN